MCKSINDPNVSFVVMRVEEGSMSLSIERSTSRAHASASDFIRKVLVRDLPSRLT